MLRMQLRQSTSMHCALYHRRKEVSDRTAAQLRQEKVMNCSGMLAIYERRLCDYDTCRLHKLIKNNSSIKHSHRSSYRHSLHSILSAQVQESRLLMTQTPPTPQTPSARTLSCPYLSVASPSCHGAETTGFLNNGLLLGQSRAQPTSYSHGPTMQLTRLA